MLSVILSFLSNIFHFALHLNPSGTFPKPLSAKEEEKYLRLAKSGDKQAKNKLVEHNLRLVAHVIKKYYASEPDRDDLISIGTIGLIKAVNTFDVDKGARLATYAARCIENEILMYFRSVRKNGSVVSINEPIETDSEGNPLTLMDIVFTEDTIADDIDTVIKSEQLYKFVEELDDEREREIIINRYGLYEKEPKTQKEIAKEFGISRSYVSRIEKKVLEKLRKRFSS